MNARQSQNTQFGRRQCRRHDATERPGPNGTLRRGAVPSVALYGLSCFLLATVIAAFWMITSIERFNTETGLAKREVAEIVNQPVGHLTRSGPVTLFSPGWFHPGAIRPDFGTVDVRITQKFPYSGFVSSDLNPTEMFMGSELEFNSMTKYFYTNPALPKRRLSEGEMIKINGLYRIIGRGEEATTSRWLALIGIVALGICLAATLLLLVRRTRLGPADTD